MFATACSRVIGLLELRLLVLADFKLSGLPLFEAREGACFRPWRPEAGFLVAALLDAAPLFDFFPAGDLPVADFRLDLVVFVAADFFAARLPVVVLFFPAVLLDVLFFAAFLLAAAFLTADLLAAGFPALFFFFALPAVLAAGDLRVLLAAMLELLDSSACGPAAR